MIPREESALIRRFPRGAISLGEIASSLFTSINKGAQLASQYRTLNRARACIRTGGSGRLRPSTPTSRPRRGSDVNRDGRIRTADLLVPNQVP
jgi:hypothetical protein